MNRPIDKINAYRAEHGCSIKEAYDAIMRGPVAEPIDLYATDWVYSTGTTPETSLPRQHHLVSGVVPVEDRTVILMEVERDLDGNLDPRMSDAQAAAIGRLAMRSRLDLLMQTGVRPAIPVVIATLVSLIASFATVMLIG